MPEVRFRDLRSGLRARDISPDSVIFTGETNFSLFSSASASVERCSFASDVHDQDSITSHLAGHELSEVMSGPDPDPNKSTIVQKSSVISLCSKEKAKDSGEAETTEDETIAVDSARSSFSRALRECQDRRLRSEVLLRKSDHRRPASLDLNNSEINPSNSSSPRFGVMAKPSASIRKQTGTVPSPGTPNFHQTSVGTQKGWSSERIPLHMNGNRRSMNTVFFPYNNNGRTLPSKWEDAERWIFSPVSAADGAARTSFQQPQRRPKSKSGPLGAPGVAYYQMFSPAARFDGGNKLVMHSPFSADNMAANGSSTQYGGGEGTGNFLIGTESCMARSISIHGCSEMLDQPPLPAHQDDETYNTSNDTIANRNSISRAVSRRDMATQMSPESSIHSSPPRLSSFSLSTPCIPSMHSSKQEIRDVPIDQHVSMTRWSGKNKSETPHRGESSQNDEDWKRKAVSIPSSGWEVSTETSKSISKVQREEAKITAWENLQKAKAEAAIRRLEMKMEKKRASSIDKIMKKLRCAQKKAQNMRGSMLSNSMNEIQSPTPLNRALSFPRIRIRPVGSLSGCFTCHAF